jgi:hypothetical protein
MLCSELAGSIVPQSLHAITKRVSSKTKENTAELLLIYCWSKLAECVFLFACFCCCHPVFSGL